MNKKIYIIISILFCACNLFAKNFLIKDITFYKDSAWQKVVYNYNDTKIVNTTTFISSDNIEWENYTYSTKQYKDGAVSEICDYTWNGNSWIMYRKSLHRSIDFSIISFRWSLYQFLHLTSCKT